MGEVGLVIFLSVVIMIGGCSRYSPSDGTAGILDSQTPEANKPTFYSQEPATPEPTSDSQNTAAPKPTTSKATAIDSPIFGNTYSNLAAGGIACALKDDVLIASSSKGHISEVSALDSEGNISILGEFYARYMNTDGNFLYYCSNDDPLGGRIHKFDLTTKEDKVIFDGYAGFLVLKGEYLYFCDYSVIDSKGPTRNLTRINTDGSQKTILSEYECMSLAFTDDWIYYVASVKNLFEIKKMTIDGSDDQKLIEVNYIPEFLNYENDRLFWIENYKNIVSMCTDGSGKKEIVTGHVITLVVRDDILYYVNCNDIDMDLYKKNLVNGESELMDKGGFYTEDMAIIDNCLYFYYDSAVAIDSVVTARLNIQTGDIERIAEPTLP